jgi:hypothetical protein
MEKLQLYHTAGLTRYAITKGIIEGSVQITTLPGLKAKAGAKGSRP